MNVMSNKPMKWHHMYPLDVEPHQCNYPKHLYTMTYMWSDTWVLGTPNGLWNNKPADWRLLFIWWSQGQTSLAILGVIPTSFQSGMPTSAYSWDTSHATTRPSAGSTIAILIALYPVYTPCEMKKNCAIIFIEYLVFKCILSPRSLQMTYNAWNVTFNSQVICGIWFHCTVPN